MKSTKASIAAFAVLLILAANTVSKLTAVQEPTIAKLKKVQPTKSKIVATRDLPAFTLIKESDVELRKGSSASEEPQVAKLKNRYLLVDVKIGGEVKDENLAPESANDVLKDAIAVSIPASPTTTLGGQLRVGELVEMVAVPAKEEAPIIKFEKLVVLNNVAPNKEANLPGTITLAVPSTERDNFAQAVGRTQYFLTRRLAVH